MLRESLLKLTQATTLGLGLLLALTTALSTGCVTPQPTPETTPDPTAAMEPAEFLRSRSNLPTHTPATTTPPYDIPHGHLLAYGDHVGEFGGIHYEGGDPRGTMHFYMTEGNFDPALIPEARERFDRFYRHVPDQKIVVHKAQYPWSRLEEWEDTISKAKSGQQHPRHPQLGSQPGRPPHNPQRRTNARQPRANRSDHRNYRRSTRRHPGQHRVRSRPRRNHSGKGQPQLQGHLRLLGRSPAARATWRDRGP